jgi:hypothetical protein
MGSVPVQPFVSVVPNVKSCRVADDLASTTITLLTVQSTSVGKIGLGLYGLVRGGRLDPSLSGKRFGLSFGSRSSVGGTR